MDKKKFNKALKIASDGESRMAVGCADLTILFQPYFDREISVLYQSSDGFVILRDAFDCGRMNMNAPENIPINEALEIIGKNPKAYIINED
jgi:hypothetical protein